MTSGRVRALGLLYPSYGVSAPVRMELPFWGEVVVHNGIIDVWSTSNVIFAFSAVCGLTYTTVSSSSKKMTVKHGCDHV
jgi:hypothetical protein